MNGVGGDSRGRRTGGSWPWLVVGLAFAVAATAALAFTEDIRWLRLGIVAALWAALVGAFLAVRHRKLAHSSEETVAKAQAIYELELEREIAARQEHELRVEAEARDRAEADSREELDALRHEISSLRDNLQALFGGDVLFERVALTAQATRMRALNEGKAVAPAERMPPAQITAAKKPANRPVENDRRTEFLGRVRDERVPPSVRREARQEPAEPREDATRVAKPAQARTEAIRAQAQAGRATADAIRAGRDPGAHMPRTAPRPAEYADEPTRAGQPPIPPVSPGSQGAPGSQRPSRAVADAQRRSRAARAAQTGQQRGQAEVSQPGMRPVGRSYPPSRDNVPPVTPPTRRADPAPRREPARAARPEPLPEELAKGLDLEWTPSWESGRVERERRQPDLERRQPEADRRPLEDRRPPERRPAAERRPVERRPVEPRRAAPEPEARPAARPEVRPEETRFAPSIGNTERRRAEPEPRTESRGGGRRRRAEGDPSWQETLSAPTGRHSSGSHARPSPEEIAANAYNRSNGYQSSNGHAAANGHHANGHRRAADSGYQQPVAPPSEPSGSHAEGLSVSDLLAAHGSDAKPPRRRRRAAD